uniref:Uncharacterized protein n=1 Tax=Anguilla anguilla TaxID=7936 RepID=A0A0E9TQL2_ANGAN
MFSQNCLGQTKNHYKRKKIS